MGGLIISLGCLFTSFATQFHQLFISVGIIQGVGVSMSRDSATLMVGQYFKRRREVVEVVLITTGTMVGQGTTLAATATMEVVGLMTTGTTMEVLDTTPADLITMATTAMVGAVTTQVATGQVGEGATLDLRPTGRWWVRLLEVESTFFLD